MKEDKVSLINPREMKAKGKVQVHVWGCGCVAHLPSFLHRDWLDMLSPPIVPPSQQPVEQPLESSTSVSVQGKDTKKCYAEKHKGDVLQIKNTGYSEMSLPHTDLTDLRIQT